MSSFDPKSEGLVRYLDCTTHGRRLWKGHVMCDGCGRVYQTTHPTMPRSAPPSCRCGARLLPGDDPADASWMARAICYACFRRIDKHHGGVASEWEAKVMSSTSSTSEPPPSAE